MRKEINCSFLLMITLNTFAQNDDPKIYPNGYIYDESTMNKLIRIVDSLNVVTSRLPKKIWTIVFLLKNSKRNTPKL